MYEILQALVENASAYLDVVDEGSNEADRRLVETSAALESLVTREQHALLTEVLELVFDQATLVCCVTGDFALQKKVLRAGLGRCSWGVPDESETLSLEGVKATLSKHVAVTESGGWSA